MPGKNRDVCHSCRLKGHFFVDCPKKRSCPLCKHAFLKCFEVEKETKNKGKLFNCCSANCGYWDWVKTEKSSGESSVVSIISTTHFGSTEAAKDLSAMFETKCSMTDEHGTEISMNVTLRRGRTSADGVEKGKEPA